MEGRHRMPLVAAALAVIAVAIGSSSAAAAQPPAVPRVAHVVLVVFENHERDAVIGSSEAPTFNALASRYGQAVDYRAITHPSFPNYLALVSGSTHRMKTDCRDPAACPQTGPTIGAQLTRSRRAWGAYAEGYPKAGSYDPKHVPFLYFRDTASRVHPLSALRPSALPAFAFVTPNRCHDMHDCSVSTGDAWLARFVKPLLRQPSTLVFIVFDEGTSDAGGGGVVPMIVAGSAVRPHSVTTRRVNHYSLLRTMEAALGLAPLGEAANAVPITGIWRR